ncbi:MAG: hypothetical protein CFH15_00172 [Alphaproteobacteria bacterium MarineAlpha5_Bin5]|nr:MAG: hypothetical protein CFH14_01163 [Alphaproteobacteria bacterium MarineAlpha5_Bin4]PPR51073.1 MAG: hypothetical protein CFH15_00172 [Alphaproteobacteria bacterium MarineAlpha5_Bin5]|tara:strand:+ start:1210 stop:1545 length:336 start_codon:yes stop_codon:yes gene_type:complete
MVKNKLIILLFSLYTFLPNFLFANPNSDQWLDSDKTYKDLIEEGFEVKGYAMNTIETDSGLKLLLFVTVLQNENDIYECQEYQTLDGNMETLDMRIVCRQLVQPYERGIGT